MIYVLIGLFGLALGSFTNALAWRVSKQSNAKSAKKRNRYSIVKGRSMCPSCKHTLGAKDLIPVLSWLSLRGKCRYCKKSISVQYPLVELLFASSLVFAYHFWPIELTSIQNYILFGIFSIIMVISFSLAIIDTNDQLLPTKLVYLMGIFSASFTVLLAILLNDRSVLLNSLSGAALLGGIFWAVYQISSGKWIGGGDVRLLFVMGLLLGWQKGLLAVVVASYLATALIIVLIVIKKYKKHMRIPFGPFLLTATYLVLLFGDHVIAVYKTLSGL